MTGTVLFGEKITNIKAKRHLKAAVILSAEIIFVTLELAL